MEKALPFWVMDWAVSLAASWSIRKLVQNIFAACEWFRIMTFTSTLHNNQEMYHLLLFIVAEASPVCGKL